MAKMKYEDFVKLFESQVNVLDKVFDGKFCFLYAKKSNKSYLAHSAIINSNSYDFMLMLRSILECEWNQMKEMSREEAILFRNEVIKALDMFIKNHMKKSSTRKGKKVHLKLVE